MLAGCLVWLWGGVAGAVFGHGWPAVGAGQLLGVLTRLPARLTNPAAAWPPAARGQLPDAAGFYVDARADRRRGAALVCVSLTRAGVTVGLGRRAGGARWAGGGELRGSAAARTGEARLALGRHRGRLLHAERRHALVAFGPPQSGKSSGLAIPALLEWDGPAVASSIKTDLLAATLPRRAGARRHVRVRPVRAIRERRRIPGRRFAEPDTWDGALEVAWRLAAAGEVDQRGVEGGDFWAIAAEQRLAPLLYTAAATGGDDRQRRALGVRPGRPQPATRR